MKNKSLLRPRMWLAAFLALMALAACEQMFQGPHPDETPTVQVQNGPGQEPTEVKVTDKDTGEVLIDKTVGDTNAIASLPRHTASTLIVAFKKHDGTPAEVELIVPGRQHVVITVNTFFGWAKIAEQTTFGRGTLGSEGGFTAGD